MKKILSASGCIELARNIEKQKTRRTSIHFDAVGMIPDRAHPSALNLESENISNDMKKSERDEQKRDSLKRLTQLLPAGSTVYTCTTRISRSGMSRTLRLFISHNGVILDISWLVASACGYRRPKADSGLIVEGAGMDMGFSVVYYLSQLLWPDYAPCIGEGCYSNDHSNGDRDFTPRECAHRDGGYTLKQQWL